MLVTNTVVAGSEGDYDLISLDQVKLELGITDNDSDNILESIITQCSKAVARYCRRQFVAQSVIQTWFPDYSNPCLIINGSNALITSRKPIVSIDSLVLDNSTIDPANYRLVDSEGMIFRLNDSGFVCAWYVSKLVTLTYVGGYDPIPEDIQRATLLWIKEFFIGVEDDPRVKSEQNYNVASFSYFSAQGEIPSGVAQMLKTYREPIAQL